MLDIFILGKNRWNWSSSLHFLGIHTERPIPLVMTNFALLLLTYIGHQLSSLARIFQLSLDETRPYQQPS
ncbi:hypothetical protein [Marinomonas sp. BSi20584]|uniref:hypothetical protein n=1 Tax=Marinomonas sp. BSi20584 TaxID=1594462 RepID=UPI0012FD57E2|nr:hypothetical protein [Marinomonas sp. BSi20584]